MKRWELIVGTSLLAAAVAGGVQTARAADEETRTRSTAHGVSNVRSTSVSGKITEIDRDTRRITIKRDDDGKTFTVTAPPEVKRFNELKVGDGVNMAYRESVAVNLAEPGSATGTTEEGAVAPQNQPPGAAMGRTTRSIVRIVSIDQAKHTVTVMGPSGEEQTVEVKDPDVQQQLTHWKKGDDVAITYTEAAAVSITPKK
jgi:Cu/Ag efflux protein CusF